MGTHKMLQPGKIPRSLLNRIGIFLFTAFVSLHLPTGIALANPFPQPDPLDFLRMDLSLLNLAIALPLAIIVEFIAFLLLISRSLDHKEFSTPKIFFSVALINLITLPSAWVFLKWIIDVPPEYSALPVLLVELLVVAVEGFFYYKVFSLRAKDALLLAFVPNLVSYIIGLVAFHYSEPHHPWGDINGW
jgi:hypothetical protein